MALARAGGPDAVVLRETTRRAGVAANAAYRHFPNREALLRAVSLRCQALVAQEMVTEIEACRPSDTPNRAAAAEAELDAIGRAYVHFAQREPGVFAAALRIPIVAVGDEDPAPPVAPYALLSAALDRCLEAGVIPWPRRPGAEALAWSAYHGLATLILDGLLDTKVFDVTSLLDDLLMMVRSGLIKPHP